MKKNNLAYELLKLCLAFIVGWFFWVCIFAALPGDSIDSKEEKIFPGAIVVLTGITGITVTLANKFNIIQNAYQKTKSTYSSIKIYEEKEKKLLDKANRVAEKYMTHEQKVHISIAKERTGNDKRKIQKNIKIYSASQFESQLENYPNLKANESIMELLKQIESCEDLLARSKSLYNESVEQYNSMIHSFPDNILRIIFRFKDAEYYKTEDDDIISDEALGI